MVEVLSAIKDFVIGVCTIVFAEVPKRMVSRLGRARSTAHTVVSPLACTYPDVEAAQEHLYTAVKAAQDTVRFVAMTHRMQLHDPDAKLLESLAIAARRKREATGGKIAAEFYFLDRDSPMRARREEDERLPAGVLIPDIESSSKYLRAWADRHPDVRVGAFTYRTYPVLRYCLVDRSVAFLSFYPPHEPGSKSPVYQIVRESAASGYCLIDFLAQAHCALGECREVFRSPG